MKTIKVKDVIGQAKRWAEESQFEGYTERARRHYNDRILAIIAMLTSIEVDRMKIDVNDYDKFSKKYDEIYDKYSKEIFG